MIYKQLRFKKEISYRQKYSNNELLFKLAKSFFFDLRLPLNLRFFFYKYFIAEYKFTSVKFNNLCLTSSKSKNVTRFLKNYRMVIKENISFVKWSGIKKSTW